MLCAIHDADTGQLRLIADLVESVNADERVAGVLAQQTYGLIGRPLSFQGDPIHELALKGIEDVGRRGDFPRMAPAGELMQLLSWARVLGVGVARIEYPQYRAIGEREIPTIRTWHPRNIRYEFPREGLPRGRWWAMTTRGEVEVTPGAGWILLLPYGEYRPWAFAPWRALALAWIVKQLAVLDRARYSEVAGQPIRLGIAPQGANERSRRRWRSALQALASDAAMVLPQGYDFKLIEATARTYEVFLQQIEWAERAITVALVGQTVTTDGAKGFSDGDNSADVSLALLRFLEKALAEALHTQLLVPWAQINFGTSTAPWPSWQVEPSEDDESRAKSIDALGKAISSLDSAIGKSGIRVDAKKLVDDMGIPVVECPIPPPPPKIPPPGQPGSPHPHPSLMPVAQPVQPPVPGQPAPGQEDEQEAE